MSSQIPTAVVAAAKTTVCAKMPGMQELPVGAAARQRDRAAEDVGEEQHEHDRLHDREDRQLRDARHALEVAPGDDQAVADRLAEAAVPALGAWSSHSVLTMRHSCSSLRGWLAGQLCRPRWPSVPRGR